ncbi:Uncharacterised protein [Xylophilus ampelinus]|nr:hypothetical protein [Variovorax sp.]VTY35058.1 Uncharacterised protein [Xylophilus ampelinus]
MAEPRQSLDPKARLAASRAALLAELSGDTPGKRPDVQQPIDGGQPPAQASGWLATVPWLPLGRRVAERWWRRHPANAMLQLARPALERRAREQPAQLMLAAAATGAVLVVVRPWRLLSATALLAMVLKTSDVADVVTTLMHKKKPTPRKDREP